MMDLQQAILSRHAIRDFGSDPVPREVVERLVLAASAAPSSMNEQPWMFYCCTGETRARLGEIVSQTTIHLSEYMEVLGPKRYEDAVHWFSGLGDAPLLIAIACPNPDSELTAINRYLSVGAALENLLLTVTAEGLAACNITLSYWVKDEIAHLLGLPAEQSIVTIVAVGYPGEVPPAAPSRNAETAVWLD
jgi:coenzyme F420-0:L-glutamate ligase / coenzyme F420-1:gamma-L-glutamate ligase